MQNELLIQCPNYFCQALNPAAAECCDRCQTRIPKRYLWAVGTGLDLLHAGDRLGDRYQLTLAGVWIDTKPGFPPDMPADITPSLESYLHLFSERLHVPQLYGLVQTDEVALLLLEQAPIYPDGAIDAAGRSIGGTLMPHLTTQWAGSSALRQLHWLWQMAQLWQPLSVEKTASTLLKPELLRVDGSCLRLLELEFDRQPVSLTALGKVWATWQPQADDVIAAFLDQLCDHLISEQIKSPEHLVAVLDQAIATHGKAQHRTLQIATSTDQGPNRPSNQDACYPDAGTSLTTSTDVSQTPLPLVIVCDGIGGHEGGEVASELAISTIAQRIGSSEWIHASADAASLSHGLDEAVLLANQTISDRNDAERRQERQRMGTTVVLGLAHEHELYMTHVGDSRAYRITRTGCYQVTTDDDVASRNVKFGYTLYREALQNPQSGSLVQALGMGSSSYLHPTVQRFVLDEDCVFVLCSDGLSDNDRVDEYWKTEIVPLLLGQTDVATVARKLVSIANTQNGHDNVTVGVVHCQLQESAVLPLDLTVASMMDPSIDRSLQPAESTPLPQTQITAPPAEPTALQPTLRTGLIEPRGGARRWIAPIATFLGLLGAAGLSLLLIPELRSRLFSPATTPTPIATTTPAPAVNLTEGLLIQLNRSNSPIVVTLLRKPEQPIDLSKSQIVGDIPSGTVFQVVGKQLIQGQAWIQLKVCSVDANPANVDDEVKGGDVGWQKESAIVPFMNQNLSLQSNQLGACTPQAKPGAGPSSSPNGSPNGSPSSSPAPVNSIKPSPSPTP